METTATLKELQTLVGGEISGDENLSVSGISSLDDAEAGDITFIAKSAYLGKAAKTKASAIIVSHKIEAPGKSLLITPNPYLAYAQIATLFHRHAGKPPGIDKSAVVGKDTSIGKDVSIHSLAVLGDRVTIGDRVEIYPHVFVGDDCVIGEETVLHANVSIRERCRIGKRVIIHAGSVIGSDGFGFAPDGRRYHKIPQVGTVHIDDDVEIGANNTIDRGALGKTWIKRGVKTDNLVHIAHNVIVGEDTLLVAQVGISGSTVIGNHVTVAGQVGVVGHVEIGDNTMIGAKTGISGSVPADSIVSGIPHMPHREWLKASRCFPLLPQMRKTLRALEERLAKLEDMINKQT